MSKQTTNHICKNVNCKNGIDGKQKEYWACNDCDKMHSYREVACSPECYKEYIEQVLNARKEITEIKKENATIIESAVIDKNVSTVDVKKSNSRTKISEGAEL